mgnify:CR=1 FL=1
MRIEVSTEGDKRRVRFAGGVNMSQEVVLSRADAERLSQALAGDADTGFETE